MFHGISWNWKFISNVFLRIRKISDLYSSHLANMYSNLVLSICKHKIRIFIVQSFVEDLFMLSNVSSGCLHNEDLLLLRFLLFSKSEEFPPEWRVIHTLWSVWRRPGGWVLGVVKMFGPRILKLINLISVIQEWPLVVLLLWKSKS